VTSSEAVQVASESVYGLVDDREMVNVNTPLSFCDHDVWPLLALSVTAVGLPLWPIVIGLVYSVWLGLSLSVIVMVRFVQSVV
jgi:hypothetical protein